ncbi:MAG: hypothetical protein E7270_03585 [Lachnospiraceae bacterium]|nr:hypothetical protein [Lachnospiraceae bacterium]
MINCKKIASFAMASVMALVALMQANVIEVEAAESVKSFKGHYYLYVSDVVDAGKAEFQADLKGGHLVTINSKAENEFVAEQVVTEGDIWLGAKKNAKGNWKWITGEKFSYKNWNESWHSNGSNEIYLRMEDGLWDDCTITENWNSEGCAYVIEWDSKSAYNAYKNGKKAAMVKNIKGTKTYNGHAYKYYAMKSTWKDASKACKKLGGYLATITSNKENTITYNLTGGANAWFGLSDAKKEGKYAWVTGERTDYLRMSKEVNNDYAGEEDYFGYFEGNNWNDYRNDDEKVAGFICEWDLSKNVILTAVKANVTVNKGKTYKLKYQVYPVKTKITYKSSDKKVATVSKKGVVTAKKRGIAKITIKAGAKKVTVKVKVK